MKKFICLECGHVFDEEDIVRWQESRGEYWGAPCYETVTGCPACRGDYVETYRCSCCDEWIADDYVKIETGERFCNNCFMKFELGEEN